MNDNTKRLPRTARLPQRALERIEKTVDGLPPLTPAQLADLSLIIYGGRDSAAA